MSRSTVYSANAVTLSFAGQNIDSGRGEDEFLRIEQSEDDFSYRAGICGEGVFSENRNRYTVVTVTLLQTSAGNDVLSAIHNASKLLGGSTAPIYVEDRNGTSKLVSDAAIILKTPDETYARDAGTVVWTIGVHNPQRHVGGH